MAKKFQIYWFQESAFVENAFLFNCRDNDLVPTTHAQISKAAIVVGAVGFVAAEQIIPGFTAQVVPFKSNRRCLWQKIELACMVSPAAPPGRAAKAKLRHFNYVVAYLPNSEAVDLAEKVRVPIMEDQRGRKLINLEIGCFEKQGQANPRRAKLL